MEAYREKTGEDVSYPLLAIRTGLSRATIESIATRRGYNASLKSIAQLCAALDCRIEDLLAAEYPVARRRGRP
jgi:DNA-binding Xre family transcriptional regulator